MPMSKSNASKSGGGFTSFGDMFDGGGKGGSGSEHYTKSHEDYKSDYQDRHGHSDPNAHSHSSKNAEKGGKAENERGGFTSFIDMIDGGGKGGSGSEHSMKSHADYMKDYKEKYGRNDPNAKSHLSSEFSDVSNTVKPASIEITIYETSTGIKATVKGVHGAVISISAPKCHIPGDCRSAS